MSLQGMRSHLERILENELSKNQSFEEAIQQARSTVAFFAQPEEANALFEQLVAAHRELRSRSTKLIDIPTAHQKDLVEQGWYSRLTVAGGIWETLRSKMVSSGLANAVDDIDKSSDSILAYCAEPHVKSDKRLGLVIGNVQSGKTANYTSVIAKALDHKYKMVVVLSGIHNNLRKQTQKRLERDLSVDEKKKDWILLTQQDADMGRTQNAAALLHGNSHVLAVVKKNKSRLENLKAFLQDLDSRQKEDTPILIIDDESDQATPDASPESQSNPTTISRLMSEIWGEVENGTYIGYTATPFANIFMDPEITDGDKFASLYPRHFIQVMPTPSNYFGAERIFGLSQEASEESDPTIPDVIRQIPNAELEFLTPGSAKEVASFVASVPESLEIAIRWFIIATAARSIRGQQKKHSTMLVHTTHRVDPHFEIQRAVEEFLEPLRQNARDGNIDDYYEVFNSEFDQAAELYTGTADAVTWPEVKKQIPNVLRKLQVVVDNGKADENERLDYSGGEAKTVIVIGGGTLSRGLTLEGLFVSYFTRTSNTYDTLLQMGRWFGYRDGYEDLQRIWLSHGLAEEYSFLATVEAELRNDVSRMIDAGQTPEDIGVRVLYHPGRLQITNPNKMRLIEKVEIYYEGSRLQTTSFNVIDHAKQNRQVTEKLLAQLEGEYSANVSEKNGTVLFRDVRFQDLESFFTGYLTHEIHHDIYKNSLQWVSENLPNKLWNVAVAAGSVSEEVFSFGNLGVQPVRRAPLEFSPGDTGVNIRALMTGDDLRIDMREIVEKNHKLLAIADPYQQRKSPEGANGNGLLVIYPISRQSKASKNRNTMRQDMDLVLEQIKPGLASDDNGAPIIGIGVVTPFDTENVVEKKGTYVAVNPTKYYGASEHLEHEFEDNEKSFDAGKS